MEEIRRPGQRTSEVYTKLKVRPDARGQTELLSWDQPPIIWAVDAFPDDPEFQSRTLRVLRSAFPETPIHPVFVMSEDGFSDRGISTFLKPALKPMAIKGLRHVLQETGFDGFKKPRVLVESSASRGACARKLLRYAERIGAQMIALGTHARRGLSRFFTGSFSEAVMSASKVPVIMTGPEIREAQRPPRAVVFPTDFSPLSRFAFVEVIDLAKKFDAEIHLFHKSIHPIDPIVQSGVHMLGGGWVSVEAYLSQPVESHEKEVKDWMKFAQSSGVTSRFVSENFREPTSEAIVEYARRIDSFSPWVAMVLQTGPVASWLLGSITRDVLRTSPYTVYVASRPEFDESFT